MPADLSLLFADAANLACSATFLSGRALDKKLEKIRELMSEARDRGIYYRDDNVAAVERLLDLPKLHLAEVKELLRLLNVLVRCAEWVEHARGDWK